MVSTGTDNDILATMPLSSGVLEPLPLLQGDDIPMALLIFHRDGTELVPLPPNASVVVGRCSPSQVQIRDNRLSREHARFTLAEGVVLVEDLRSTNGTWVRGVRVTNAELEPGDEVRLGRVIVCVRALAPEEEDAGASLLSHERFRVALEDEVLRARHFGRHLAILMVRAARAAADGAHVSRWHSRVRGLLRPVDRVGLYAPEALAVLLPEAEPEQALALAREIAGSQQEPPLLVGISTFPCAARAAEELLEICWSAAQAATLAHPVEAPQSSAWTRSAADDRGAGVEPVAVSPVMRAVVCAVARLARASIPVLLQGETGTGKEVLARAIHEQGPRRSRPMVSVNCGAIPQQLVESTLFGHERGAFTGASQQQKGVFEAADGGTVFLDEVGELPAAAQAALLRVLETKRVTRVGSNREIEVDARVIAATHRDLEAMCQAKSFRPDLLYRLNAMTLVVPPLRTRPEEIEPLALRFLNQASEAGNRSLLGITPQALMLLQGYTWPGNVRELRNAIERAVVIADGVWITEQDLPERVRAAGAVGPQASPEAPPRDPAEPTGTPAGGKDNDLKTRLQRYEAELVVEALREAAWNQSEAARRLGMPLRTLVHKIKALGIKKLGYGPG